MLQPSTTDFPRVTAAEQDPLCNLNKDVNHILKNKRVLKCNTVESLILTIKTSSVSEYAIFTGSLSVENKRHCTFSP